LAPSKVKKPCGHLLAHARQIGVKACGKQQKRSFLPALSSLLLSSRNRSGGPNSEMTRGLQECEEEISSFFVFAPHATALFFTHVSDYPVKSREAM
jgi:hypothetical protein